MDTATIAVLVFAGAALLAVLYYLCYRIFVRLRYPLIFAVQKRNSDRVRTLLRRDPALIHACDDRGNTPLHEAASIGQVKIAQLLLDAGADLQATDRTQATPLHNAAVCDRVDMVKWLLAHGVPIDPRDQDGKTPLALAACDNALATVQYLVERGADVNACDHAGFPLICEIIANENPRTIRFLQEHGLDESVMLPDGTTVRDALTAGSEAVGTVLRQYGAAR